jgi:hypothetical protein
MDAREVGRVVSNCRRGGRGYPSLGRMTHLAGREFPRPGILEADRNLARREVPASVAMISRADRSAAFRRDKLPIIRDIRTFWQPSSRLNTEAENLHDRADKDRVECAPSANL